LAEPVPDPVPTQKKKNKVKNHKSKIKNERLNCPGNNDASKEKRQGFVKNDFFEKLCLMWSRSGFRFGSGT
jgi:hypothetical protein